MSRTLLTISTIAAMLLSVPVAAQPDTAAKPNRRDTTRVVRGREVVVVESSSILLRQARSAQPMTVVDRSELEMANARDLSDAVALSPGTSVRQYGGQGGLRTVSVRGTSAQQTILLIDGVRYGSSAGDAFDFSNIPAATIEQVEVLRGGDAARFGANALGGVVNLITSAAGGTAVRGGGTIHVGSFGDFAAGGAVRGGFGGNRLDGAIHFTRASGEYPFSYSEFGIERIRHRHNADFSNLFARAGWSLLEDGMRLSASVHGFSSERGTPGAVVQGSLEQSQARLAEGDLFGIAAASFFNAEWMGTIGGTARTNQLRYDDPESRLTGPAGTHSRFQRTEGSLTGRVRRQFGSDGSVEASIEMHQAQLNGNNLDPSVGQSVARRQLSAAVAADWLIGPLVANDELLLQAALRADLFSDVGNALSPSVGVSYRPTDLPLRLRVHASGNFRAPSFTEQYYLNYGNAKLRPERSVSVDAGVLYQFGERFLADATFFQIATSDLILSVPRSPVSWSAANVGRATTRGLELGASGTLLDGHLRLRLAWTQMNAQDRSGGAFHGKELPYLPRQTASGFCQAVFGAVRCGLTASYSSYRYSLPSNSPASILPGYWLVGGNVAYDFAIADVPTGLRAEVQNLFGTEYHVVRNYPMPGRSFRIIMECKIP